jgi:hypothetical protein
MSSSRLTFDRTRDGKSSPWTIALPLEKLALRGRLPGAFSFDRATETLSRARAAGIGAGDLLSLALPSSWLVNSAVPSTSMAKWHIPPFPGYFRTLIAHLEIGVHELANLDEKRIADAITPLAVDGQGAGAISKIVASLVPKSTPLMPDAAIAFALGTVAAPTTADAQTAGPEFFAPMLKWFARVVVQQEDLLRELAKQDAKARAPSKELEPAQLFDRLLWFESAGYRVMRGAIVNGAGYHWLARGEGSEKREAIVRVPGEYPANPKHVLCIDLEIEPESAWKTAALKAFDDVSA